MGANRKAVERQERQAAKEIESLKAENERLRAENDRLRCGVAFGVLEQLRERVEIAERERDKLILAAWEPSLLSAGGAILSRGNWRLGHKFGWANENEDLVRGVRLAAGLDAEPAGEGRDACSS